ncbi:non-oxidative hydroxyarylic acid decarboxylases subunit D [Streptomyces sp. NPDC023723]|uniref:non-oxidative hydroxyarylic acid decarboxylases subunit D n=1 Tax=Streptomyces sp. NPDC023723 TaxID=3154323 RepID=UPI0033FFACD9
MSALCPRCSDDRVRTVAHSPVPGVWDVLQCARCLYMWRTTEPARRTSPDAYPARFRMTAEDIAAASEVPAVPPLLAR